MGVGRVKMSLHDFTVQYNSEKRRRERVVKAQQKAARNKYEGLHECFMNVKPCNMASKLAYY